MNKKFVLIILAFTITVPGFFLFSYLYLGVFSDIKKTKIENFTVSLYAGDHNGDYNKVGEQVVKTQRILASFSLPCEPVLVYFENAITMGKPYLKSAGGCITDAKTPVQVVQALTAEKRRFIKIQIVSGYRFDLYAQTAIALRKMWTELARLTDAGNELKFPMVQIVRETGQNEFYIGLMGQKP